MVTQISGEAFNPVLFAEQFLKILDYFAGVIKK
jgi:hypothetical protein